jgi:hypothetical protein
MANPDPTDEIKSVRHRLGAEFDYDLDRIVEDIQRRQTESGRKYVTMPPRKIADNKAMHPSGVGTVFPSKESTSAAG